MSQLNNKQNIALPTVLWVVVLPSAITVALTIATFVVSPKVPQPVANGPRGRV